MTTVGILEEIPVAHSGEPDEALVDRWQAGDWQARDELLARYYKGLRRFFEGELGDAAADLTQSTMMATVRAIDGFQRRSSFRTFLFSIARRQLAYFLRQESRRRPGSSFDEASYRYSMTSPSGVVARREEERLLLYALHQIPQDQRIAIELFYWEGMSNKEIAGVLEVKVSTVTTRLARARRKIYEAIEQMRPSTFAARGLQDDFARWMMSLCEERTGPAGKRRLGC